VLFFFNPPTPPTDSPLTKKLFPVQVFEKVFESFRKTASYMKGPGFFLFNPMFTSSSPPHSCSASELLFPFFPCPFRGIIPSFQCRVSNAASVPTPGSPVSPPQEIAVPKSHFFSPVPVPTFPFYNRGQCLLGFLLEYSPYRRKGVTRFLFLQAQFL